MPRIKQQLRVRHGQCAYMLECRLVKIAKRKYPRNTRAYSLCLSQLQASDSQHTTFLVHTHWHSPYSGMITLVSPRGIRYKVHHTDVVRV